MFFASGPGFRMPLELSGFSGGNAAIMQLQRALVDLSQDTRRPAINPGVVSGTISNETMDAVLASMDLLAEQLPTWTAANLQKGLMSGSHSAGAKNLVAQNAQELTMAALTATAKYKTHNLDGVGITMPSFAMPTVMSTAWAAVKTPAGILITLGALFLGYKLFFAPKS